MKRLGFGIGFVVAVWLVAAGPSRAALSGSIPEGGVTRQEVVHWLAGHGMTATIHDDSANRTIVSSTTGDINFDIYFYDCKSDRCGAIQYAAGWTSMRLGTADKVNDWDSGNRFLRSYINQSGVWAEYDLEVAHGATWELLDQSLERFSSSIVTFKTFMGE